MTWEAIIYFAGLAVIAFLAPTVTSALMVLVLPGTRAKMAGGGPRLFKAVWLWSASLVTGFSVAGLVSDRTFGALPRNTIAHDVFIVLCSVLVAGAVLWLFGRLPRTASLLRDLGVAMRRRPTNFGKA